MNSPDGAAVEESKPPVHKVYGKLTGLKHSDLRSLERLYRRRIPPERALTSELAREMSRLSFGLGRRLGVQVDRKGKVQAVVLGDKKGIGPVLEATAGRPTGRFRGIRFLFTDPREEGFFGPVLADLVRYRLDMAIQVRSVDESEPLHCRMAHLLPPNKEGAKYEVSDRLLVGEVRDDFRAQLRALEREFQDAMPQSQEAKGRERAILLGVVGTDRDPFADLLDLARSCGAEVVSRVSWRRRREDPKTLIPKGKVEEIAMEAIRTQASTLILGFDLAAAQTRNLEELTSLKVVDRSLLILDLFAQRARTREGRLQVELARLRYLQPRLVRGDDSLSRIRGGIGSNRGVGETKVERDRRRLKDRIVWLSSQIDSLGRRRQRTRSRRERRGIPVVALLGYTNAGKSTLLNTLTGSEVLAEERMFSTLDPTSRRLGLERDRHILLTDTVGFIDDLPKDLIQAFRATLEELRAADVFLHLADASEPRVFERIQGVENVLGDMGLCHVPRVLVFNKADKIDREAFAPLERRFAERPRPSALTTLTLSIREDDVRSRLLPFIEEALGLNRHREEPSEPSPLP